MTGALPSNTLPNSAAWEDRHQPKDKNIKFFVDPEEEDRDNDTTSDCMGSKHFALKDDVSYKCSCCEADGTQRKRTRNLAIMKPGVRFSSLTDADINFFEKGNTDLCDLQQNTWAPLPKPLVVDSGAGETVMPVDWLTSHHLTQSPMGQEQMISTQQPMAAKCTMKDKENWMFAHLTAENVRLGPDGGTPAKEQ